MGFIPEKILTFRKISYVNKSGIRISYKAFKSSTDDIVSFITIILKVLLLLYIYYNFIYMNEKTQRLRSIQIKNKEP